MSSVKIGPSFFAKARNDYRDWKFALIREFAQNSIDAKSTKIDVNITLVDGNTRLQFSNNGDPMSREILVDKLLAIGETGKAFVDSIGGFGRAKELLLFCHKEYSIRTGNYLVNGSGGEYDLVETDYHDGTVTTVLIDGDHVYALECAVHVFTAYSQWRGEFMLNGDVLSVDLRKGSPRVELECGRVYTNNSCKNKLIVRMRGIVMFYRNINLDKCVVLELKEPSVTYLSSNRDSLQWAYGSQVDAFIDSLSMNKRVLDNKPAEIIKFEGELMRVPGSNVVSHVLRLTASSVIENISASATDVEYVSVINEQAKNVLDYGFMIYNESGMNIPNHYRPDSELFGSYAKKAANIWCKMMLALHVLCNVRKEFMVGFVFSETNVDGEVPEALHMNRDCDTYLLNIVDIVRQTNSNSRSMRNKLKLTDFGKLVSLAAHEFVHGAYDIDCHNEKFANKLTDVMQVVCDNLKIFKGCMR